MRSIFVSFLFVKFRNYYNRSYISGSNGDYEEYPQNIPQQASKDKGLVGAFGVLEIEQQPGDFTPEQINNFKKESAKFENGDVSTLTTTDVETMISKLGLEFPQEKLQRIVNKIKIMMSPAGKYTLKISCK